MYFTTIRGDLMNVTLEEIKRKASDYVADGIEGIAVYAFEETDIYQLDLYRFYSKYGIENAISEIWLVSFDEGSEKFLAELAEHLMAEGRLGA